MRQETFPYGYDVFAKFPRARVYANGEGWIAYLAEYAGAPHIIVDSRAGSFAQVEGLELDDPLTVLTFEDENERAAYLAEQSRKVEPSWGNVRPTKATAER